MFRRTFPEEEMIKWFLMELAQKKDKYLIQKEAHVQKSVVGRSEAEECSSPGDGSFH